MCFSHSLFTVQVCQSKQQLSDWKEKLLVDKSKAMASILLNMKSFSHWISLKKKFPTFKNQQNGFNTSHLMGNKTWKISVFTLIGVDLSSLLRLTHTMTLLSSGSLTLSRQRKRLSLEIDLLFFLNLITSHVLITIELKVRQLDHTNTHWLKLSVWNSHQVWKSLMQTRTYTWLLLPSDLKLCMVRQIAISSPKVNTESLKCWMMSSLYAVWDQQETWPSKTWLRKLKSILVFKR